MRIIELKDLRRKETPLHYIREFTGIAVLEREGKVFEKALVFTVERRPSGAPEVSARFVEEPEWPILPLLRSIKDLVTELDKSGGLP